MVKESKGFKSPTSVKINNGPFRSTPKTFLQPLQFNRKRLPRRVRKTLDYLPEGIAIVGGYARGLYLENMKNVDDLDLAVSYTPGLHLDNIYPLRPYSYHKVQPTYHKLDAFLDKMGYEKGFKFTYRTYNGSEEFIEFLPHIPKEKVKKFSIWNGNKPIKPKPKIWCWKSPDIDILISPTDSLEDLIDQFDISITQFAYLNGGLYASEIALDDIEKKQFRLLRNTKPERVKKYTSKGYKHLKNQHAGREDPQFLPFY